MATMAIPALYVCPVQWSIPAPSLLHSRLRDVVTPVLFLYRFLYSPLNANTNTQRSVVLPCVYKKPLPFPSQYQNTKSYHCHLTTRFSSVFKHSTITPLTLYCSLCAAAELFTMGYLPSIRIPPLGIIIGSKQCRCQCRHHARKNMAVCKNGKVSKKDPKLVLCDLCFYEMDKMGHMRSRPTCHYPPSFLNNVRPPTAIPSESVTYEEARDGQRARHLILAKYLRNAIKKLDCGTS
ncbi:hypothetical protein F4861DRAFT_510778 [Xylaria intraflava]|nr:hypothetical protein F4861DRAFT_510778 [Xylaria intraflava]